MPRPMACRSKYESDVVRRNVEWLTADTISSINFTPIHALGRHDHAAGLRV